MQEASESFMSHVGTLISNTGDFSEQLLKLRKLLEANNIPNKVVDGTIPFPEDQQSIRDGISLEFRYFVCRPRALRVDMNKISLGTCHSSILEVKSTLYAIFPFELNRDSFV